MKNSTKQVNKVTKRGPKEKLSDQEMKELALKIKNKFKHQQITYSILERETHIGRNTWMRRIKDYIDELNRPIIRSMGLSPGDEVYFPNIENLFEVYGDNRQKIINELHHFELMFHEIYKERHLFQEKLKRYEGFNDKIESYKYELSTLKRQMEHYKNLYEKITVSSIEPHLRDEYGVKNNLIAFNAHEHTSVGLNKLEEHFPSIEVSDHKEEQRSKNMNELANQFPDIF